MAAGALMIVEAGGRVADLQGSDRFFETGEIVAGSPRVFDALIKALPPGD